MNFSLNDLLGCCLHKQIDKLNKDKRKLQDRVQYLEATNTRAPMQCCCEDLKRVFEDRASSLEQISDHWKEKT